MNEEISLGWCSGECTCLGSVLVGRRGCQLFNPSILLEVAYHRWSCSVMFNSHTVTPVLVGIPIYPAPVGWTSLSIYSFIALVEN